MAAVELIADDSMVIGGGIHGGKLTGQEGALRAVAIVAELGETRLAIVACDVLMLNRDLLDPLTEKIADTCRIPADLLLINATHTHHAPSTVTIHGYERDLKFCRVVQDGILAAVTQACERLATAEPATMRFALGEETTFGQNSRLLLSDGTIYWIGPYDDAVRPTGPFDKQLPVLAFHSQAGPQAVLFNHSTHTIGARKPARSPSLYGLTAQELEAELGAVVCFLEGASGSTHNLKLKPDEAIANLKQAVRQAYAAATPQEVRRLAGRRQQFTFKVRTFDEATEDVAVSSYCRKRAPANADGIIEVFRRQRAVLAPQQGQVRETWIQALCLGDVAIVGVPAEFFTQLGLDIKERSPFPHTIVAELANDWIGYLPNEEAHRLGGYQTWTGLHSYAEPGTGERVVDEVVALLQALHAEGQPPAVDGKPAPSANSSAIPAADGPRTPADEARSFHFADPDLRTELVAAEPEVNSPVALCWDADLRLYVAEMSDYPVGPRGGRIRQLTDADGDGVYEQSEVFAQDLNFPNGVLPYQGGLLVTAAPDVLFLKDTDGDGQVDVRQVVLTGFNEGNQQLRVNGLYWGLDNRVYGANGRSDGEVRRPDESQEQAVSLRRRDFSFAPEQGPITPLSGQSQFGLARDDWGRRFLSWNTIPLRHAVLEAPPDGVDVSRVADILPLDDAGQIFPRGEWPQTFNREPAGYFNALCGLTIYRGDVLAAYAGQAFVGESLASLVHRRVLHPRGATFEARRGEERQEFLAAGDPWFHPVYLTTGPDGALYLADFYRQFVEHPQWVPEHLKESQDWRHGSEHGRIWRIVSRTAPRRSPVQPLAGMTTAELVPLLAAANGWTRDTAQRLLVERQDRTAVAELEALVDSPESAWGQVHALWTLAGLKALTPAAVLAALHSPHPAVRENSARLASQFWRDDEIRQALVMRASDVEPGVQLQAIVALGQAETEAARTELANVASVETVLSDRWLMRAVLDGFREPAITILERLTRQDEAWLRSAREYQDAVLTELGLAIGATSDDVTCRRAVACVLNPNLGLPQHGQLAVLAGMERGLARHQRSLGELVQMTPSNAWQPLVELARSESVSDGSPVWMRLTACEALSLLPAKQLNETLAVLVAPGQPASVQAAAIRMIVRIAPGPALESLLAGWDRLDSAARRELTAGLLATPEGQDRVLTALEDEHLLPTDLDPSQREWLLADKDEARRARAERLLPPAVGERAAVVERYVAELPAHGDSGRGQALFQRHCQACHRLAGSGNRVGPELGGLGLRSRATLVSDILDPSRQFLGEYSGFTVITTDGRLFAGLLAGENAAAIRLRRAEGAEDVVPREQVEVFRGTGKSLMPEGFEQYLDSGALADLLEFLQAPPAVGLGIQ